MKVDDAFVLFNYGNDVAAKQMKDLDVQLHALASWDDVISAAKSLECFDDATLLSVQDFLNDPVAWSVAHGGPSEECAQGLG